MRLLPLLCLLFAGLLAAPAAELQSLVTTLMNDEHELKGVPFSNVVYAATGKRVIPLDPTNAADRALISRISHALDAVLLKLNSADSPAKTKRRINEVSALFESAIKAELNAIDGFECDFPKLASGAHQRSGYPDLRLVDKKTGGVCYLDPKLYERGSRASSLRTFYFEPKRETNKILDDAHHFIVGIEHDGKTGAWRFLNWELVDLASFRVKLKAEFQAGNRDLYLPEAIAASSRTNAVPK
jgi:hypothetical protein